MLQNSTLTTQFDRNWPIEGGGNFDFKLNSSQFAHAISQEFCLCCYTVYRCCSCCCCCFVCTWGRNLTQIFHLKFVLFGFWVYFSQAPWNDLCFMLQPVCVCVCVGVDLYVSVYLSVLSLPTTTTTSKVPLFPFLVCPFSF